MITSSNGKLLHYRDDGISENSKYRQPFNLCYKEGSEKLDGSWRDKV